MTETTRYTVDCPHPACETELRVPGDAPAGEYQCQCHSCTVRLSWATKLTGERTPYVVRVEKGK